MQFVADRFWDVRPGHERLILWNHLVLAAGNFKRQAPSTPPSLDSLRVGVSDRKNSVTVPGTRMTLRKTDPGIWEALQVRTPGLGVATTTTLLSALWPGFHVIIDQLVFRAVTGITAYERKTYSATTKRTFARRDLARLRDVPRTSRQHSASPLS